MATSYYEAVGLLAICDAIDSVEGIPFRAGEKPFYPPDYSVVQTSRTSGSFASLSLPAPYPPLVNTQSYNQNQGQTLAQNQNQNQNQNQIQNQNQGQNQAPNQGPNSTPFLQHPLLAHIPLTVSSPVGSGTITYAAEQQAAFNSLGPMPGVPGPNMPLPPPATTLLSQPPGVSMGLPRPGVGVPMPQPGPPPPQPQGSLPPPSEPTGPPGPVAPPQRQPPQQFQSQPPRPSSGASTSASPAPAAPGQEQYKTEECPLCGRAFKGPKASTHKQQHIRRLHPEHYTPKRGGKKRAGA